MKLADIPPGSKLAYRCATKLVAEQVEFEVETCRRLLGTEPEELFELLAKTPRWTIFFRPRQRSLPFPQRARSQVEIMKKRAREGGHA